MSEQTASAPGVENDVLRAARSIAEDLLFPTAISTDTAPVVPAGHLDALVEAGFYGLPGPPEVGGLGADLPTICSAIEILAGGCLTTTFVWIQHLDAVHTVAATPFAEVREEWLEPLCRGRRRAGLVRAGVLPGPSKLHARPDGAGWLFTGTAPWLSGWGRIDVVFTAARDDDGNAVWALLDARESDTFAVEPVALAAVNASATVRARFRDSPVPVERVVAIVPEERWAGLNPIALRIHASLALGIAGRCCGLLGPSPLDDALAASRAALAETPPESMPAARAAASDLALRAASSLLVSVGSRGVGLDDHAQRLAREALFLLVFGSRAPVRAALLERLGAASP